MVEKITKWMYLEPLIFRKDFLHLAEISKKVRKNHSVVRQYLNHFEKDGVIKKTKVGRMSMYKINENYPLIIQIISLIEKEKIIQKSDELVLREFVSLSGKLNGNLIIFGSFVENPKRAKDVDLLVVGKNKDDFSEIGKKINKKIHLISVESFEEVTSALKEETKLKHLIIKGVEETVKWLI